MLSRLGIEATEFGAVEAELVREYSWLVLAMANGVKMREYTPAGDTIHVADFRARGALERHVRIKHHFQCPSANPLHSAG